MKTKLLLSGLFLSFLVLTAHAENDLTDGQIAQILLNANSIDIRNGEIARDRATHPDVIVFANRMINDHNDSNKQAEELMKKINLNLKENPISKELNDDAEKVLGKLKDAEKKNFDKEYIKAEIKLHEKVINIAESQLAPNVKNQELKALLENTHPILVSHLEHAKKVLESLD